MGTMGLREYNNVYHADDSSGILNLGKLFIQCFSSLTNFLKAVIKPPSIIFNMFTVILLLVIVLKFSTIEGTSLQTL